MDAGDHIVAFIDENGIRFEVWINDEFVDKAEEREARKLPAAITIFEQQRKVWWSVFRRLVLNAPEEIFRTMVWHEAIHMWIYPVLFPAPRGYKKISHPHFRAVMDLREMYAREPNAVATKPSKSNYEEALVSFINRSWGRDESAALSWIKSQQTLSP